jgi:hypothetical protein
MSFTCRHVLWCIIIARLYLLPCFAVSSLQGSERLIHRGKASNGSSVCGMQSLCQDLECSEEGNSTSMSSAQHREMWVPPYDMVPTVCNTSWPPHCNIPNISCIDGRTVCEAGKKKACQATPRFGESTPRLWTTDQVSCIPSFDPIYIF